MSNYPNPPSQYPQGPHQYYAGAPGHDALTPLRRASVMLFIIGGLLTLMGTCSLLSVIRTSAEELIELQRVQMGGSMPQELPLSPSGIKTVSIVLDSVIMLLGLGFVMCGANVRTGKRSTVIATMILCGILLVLCGLMFLLGLVALAINTVLGGMFLCSAIVPAILLGITMTWLAQGMKGIGSAALAQQQFQMQMWQHQQMQQAYGQQYQQPQQGGYPPTTGSPPGYGYGYGVAPQQQQPQQQTPPPSPPSQPNGGSDVPPRQE